MQQRIAIIGAASGQYPLCLKAREMGLETYCFANIDGGCAAVVDHFVPISILDKDDIVCFCRKAQITAVATNASELTANIAAYVAEQLELIGTSYQFLIKAHNKAYVRAVANTITELEPIQYVVYNGFNEIYPCVVKPTEGSAKKGVSFVENAAQLHDAIAYASVANTDILIEEYVEGKEISIECLSYQGKHHIVQITDKDCSGAPHFIELGHHQPANIPNEIKSKICRTIPHLLSMLGYTNGPSHIECKYCDNKLYLIEANLRGGGDNISNVLVQLSTGIDYLKGILTIALGTFTTQEFEVQNKMFSGIYYLCSQTKDWLPFFQTASQQPWFVEGQIYSTDLHESHSNYERDGYVIYQSSHKIIPLCNE